jgi:hypothetical protein
MESTKRFVYLPVRFPQIQKSYKNDTKETIAVQSEIKAISEPVLVGIAAEEVQKVHKSPMKIGDLLKLSAKSIVPSTDVPTKSLSTEIMQSNFNSISTTVESKIKSVIVEKSPVREWSSPRRDAVVDMDVDEKVTDSNIPVKGNGINGPSSLKPDFLDQSKQTIPKEKGPILSDPQAPKGVLEVVNSDIVVVVQNAKIPIRDDMDQLDMVPMKQREIPVESVQIAVKKEAGIGLTGTSSGVNEVSIDFPQLKLNPNDSQEQNICEVKESSSEPPQSDIITDNPARDPIITSPSTQSSIKVDDTLKELNSTRYEESIETSRTSINVDNPQQESNVLHPKQLTTLSKIRPDSPPLRESKISNQKELSSTSTQPIRKPDQPQSRSSQGLAHNDSKTEPLQQVTPTRKDFVTERIESKNGDGHVSQRESTSELTEPIRKTPKELTVPKLNPDIPAKNPKSPIQKETSHVSKSVSPSVVTHSSVRPEKREIPNISQISYKKVKRDARFVSPQSLKPLISSADIVFESIDLYERLGDGEGEFDSVEVVYPLGQTEKFPLVVPKRQDYDPLGDLLTTITLIASILPEEAVGNEHKGMLRNVLKAGKTHSIEQFKQFLIQFNQIVVDHSEKLSNNEINAELIPYNMLLHILEQSYARSIAPQVNLLSNYQGFSNNVYGEIKSLFVNEIIKNAAIESDSIFLDLGSGIGNVVLQVAAQCCCESYGIEIMEAPASLAKKQRNEFVKRMHAYGQPCGRIFLKQGDFLVDEGILGVIAKADVIFVNKYFIHNLVMHLMLN